MNIVFFVSAFPVLSETFISNEIFMLQKLGAYGCIVSYRQCVLYYKEQPRVRQIRLPRLMVDFCVVSKNNKVNLLINAAGCFIHNPFGYLRAVIILLKTWNHEHLRTFIHANFVVRELCNRSINLVYIHDGEDVSLLGLLCARMLGVNCGIMFHTKYIFSEPDLLQQKLECADFSIFQSNYTAKYASRASGASRGKRKKFYVVSSPGVDTKFFSQYNKITLYKQRKQVSILTMGRLEEMKGFSNLIQAMALLRDRGVSAKCVIVGEGSLRPELEDLITRLNLVGMVDMVGAIGHSRKLHALYMKSDVFILPSVVDTTGDRDMQPNAVKEAMSMGMLTITTRLGGIEEVITHGYNGFLMTTPSPQNIAREVMSVWRLSTSKKEQISINARNTIVSQYEEKMISSKLLALLRSYSSG